MKRPPFILPIPWRDALPLFPSYAADILQRCGNVFLSRSVEVFPCKTDGVSFNGQTYCSFLTLNHDPSEGPSFTVSRQDFFPSGGADGDCCSFPTREEALQWANQEIQTEGYNLDDEEIDTHVAAAIGDKVTITERRLELRELIVRAIESQRQADTDLRAAYSEACGNGPVHLVLFDLLEPVAKIGNRLAQLVCCLGDSNVRPEAVYPPMTVNDTLDGLRARCAAIEVTFADPETVEGAARTIFHSLPVEAVAYARDNARGPYRGFAALHDFCDANMLLPGSEDYDANDFSLVTRHNAIMEEVTRLILTSN